MDAPHSGSPPIAVAGHEAFSHLQELYGVLPGSGMPSTPSQSGRLRPCEQAITELGAGRASWEKEPLARTQRARQAKASTLGEGSVSRRRELLRLFLLSRHMSGGD